MDATVLTPGTVIDRYTVEDTIGQGGMAMVWRVRHNELGSVHALKILLMGALAVRDRLVQEGRVQAALRHPNLVAVTDLVVLQGGNPGLIMEYVQGPSLERRLEEGPLSLEQVDVLAEGIFAGVEEAHRHELVHRDLKPANILLEPGDGTYVPKVADFGLAKLLDDGGGVGRGTRSGSSMGTPQYMAPEQVRDAKNVGPAADIFALGSVLYEMVTHRRPFDGDDLLLIFNSIAAGKYEPPRTYVPSLPTSMESAIVAALQIDAADRPSSVADLADIWFEGRPRPSASRGKPLFPGVQKLVAVTGAGQSWTSKQATLASGGAFTLPESPPSSTPPPQAPPSRPISGSVSPAVAGTGAVLALASVGTFFLVGGLVLVLGIGIGQGWFGGEAATDPDVVAATPEGPEVIEVPVPVPVPVPTEPADPDPQPKVVQPEPTEPPEPEPDADALTGLLAHADPAQRIKGVRQLARKGDRESWTLLGRMVREDKSPRVRTAAWRATLDAWNARRGEVDILQETLGWQLAKWQ